MKAILLSLLATAAVATAQSPLTTSFANNNGGAAGGAVYFDLECLDPAGLTITAFDLNFQEAAGAAGTVEIYIKPTSWAPHTDPWIGPISTGTVAATAGVGLPTAVTLSDPIELGPGCKIGVAIVNDTNLSHAYTTATALPPTVATTELELTVGGGSNAPFAGTAFSPRMVNTNIYYSPGGSCPSLATVVEQGAGCIAQYASFYEVMPAGTNDLDGMIMTGTPNGAGGYDVSLAPGAGFSPGVGAVDTGAPDDGVVDTATVGGTLGIFVGSNCWIATGAGNSTGFAPDVATFLANPGQGVYSWTDFDPTDPAGGLVWYEEVGTTAIVTYDGCFGWGTTDPNFVQFTLDTASGVWTVEWAGIGAGNPEDMLVGYSPAGASSDPGASDISAGGISTTGTDTDPLALSALNRPIQGMSANNFDVMTSNIPAGALSHFRMVGLSRPSLPLDGLGMPGCFQNAGTELYSMLDIPAGGPDLTWTAVTIPAGPVFFNGFQFNVQAAIFGTGANGFLGLGALTSNGLKCTVGDL